MAGATRTTTHPTARTRSWWGWGWADAHPDDAECTTMGALLPGTLARPLPVPRISDLSIKRPAVEAPRSLSDTVTADPGVRAAHAMGKAYRDVVRALHGRPGRIPDLVAHPENDREVADLLEWAANTASRSSRSAAARRCRAAWSTGATPTAPCCPWT